jgi:hypothetical protein
MFVVLPASSRPAIQPLGRIRFLVGLTAANSLILLVTLVSFAFLPTGSGHVAVLVIMGALIWWWYSLHARRFAGAGRGRFWPGAFALMGFATFALSYTIIAALWSSPEVQAEAFRTGGSDYRKHVETSETLIGMGRWFASWAGAAGAVLLAGFLAIVMGGVALLTGFVSAAALLMSSHTPVQVRGNDLFREIPRMFKR